MQQIDEYGEKVINRLKELTNHDYVQLTNCGNSAIFVALAIAKKLNPKAFVLIPDQGGWYSYKYYPKLLYFDTKVIKTNDGIIDLEDLEKKAKTGSAFIFSSMAGYLAPQPLKEIARICKENNCLVIEDATGSIGVEGLCNGKYSDFIVCSFSKWKVVDTGYGGFISAKENFEDHPALTLTKYNIDTKLLFEKLEKISTRINKLFEMSEKIKKEFENFVIIHRKQKGINVAIRFTNDEEKNKIIDLCKKKNYDYTLCPRYDRVNEKAVCIEVKRVIK